MSWFTGSLGARASLGNPSRLHGLRTEAMFRAVLVALGRFQLLVEEDEGQVYYEDGLGPVKLPDYRAVDADGRQLLIEVKAVPPSSRRLHHSIPASEVEGLCRYGELTGAPVAVAHYWSAANLWTLVDLDLMQPTPPRTGGRRCCWWSLVGGRDDHAVPVGELQSGVDPRGRREVLVVDLPDAHDGRCLVRRRPCSGRRASELNCSRTSVSWSLS